MSVHDELSDDDCHWYVIVPAPPLASVIDVNAAAVAPEDID